MSIIYNEKEKIFKLDTSGASYVMGIEEKIRTSCTYLLR